MPINFKRISTHLILCFFVVNMFLSGVPIYAQSDEKASLDTTDTTLIKENLATIEPIDSVQDVELVKEKASSINPEIVLDADKEVLDVIKANDLVKELSVDELIVKEDLLVDEMAYPKEFGFKEFFIKYPIRVFISPKYAFKLLGTIFE